MKHISIIVPRGHTSLVNIEGSQQILNQVNSFLSQKGAENLFQVQLVGLPGQKIQTYGSFSISPDIVISQLKKTNLIIIPAIHDDPAEVLKNNKEFIPWILRHYAAGAEIASFCVGAFFLAATGLLNGKKCATHWIHAGNFRKMFPEVLLVDDKIMTQDSRIYTSGGAYSYLNLLLYLIEKYAGREMAILISKTFMIDIDKQSQSPFIIFKRQWEHTDKVVIKAQEYIEKHFEEKINIEELSRRLALSRRSLERRFKKATGNTPSQYIQRVKIEAAKKQLETSRKNINEVMYDVGYCDVKAFRNLFKKCTGISPVQYRYKYNREHLSA